MGALINRLHRLHRLHRDEHGTASIEAAIMLPFFIICWAGLLYYFHVHDNTLRGALSARHCAWSFSNAGCLTVPEGCERFAGGAVSDDQPGWIAALSDVPVFGALVESIFGEVVTVGVDREFDRPPMFGGGTVAARASYSIMCNEQPRDMGDVVHDTLCSQVSGTIAGIMGC